VQGSWIPAFAGMTSGRGAVAEAWARDVVSFWFGLDSDLWWNTNRELDEQCRERFLELWREQRAFPVEHFLEDAETALAAVVLFDQLPRNMFRGHAESFATDHLALAIAKAAVERGYDQRFDPRQRGILYMPFQHSEDLDDQNRALLLFTALGDEGQLAFARRHRDVIARFGRFPHRNAMLGRAPRPEELAAGDVDPTHL
jgi:uncharacterized protein (DUF924 family)